MSRYWHSRRRKGDDLEKMVMLLVLMAGAAIISPQARPIIASFWYVYVFAGAIVVFVIAKGMYHRYRLSKAGMDEIDKMSETDFEIYLATLFTKLGYSVQHTGKTGDYGSDLVIVKNGFRTAVQAKRYVNHVGPDAVREVVTVLKLRNCSSGMVITNNYFTDEAKTLARVNNITLWNRDDLVNAILKTAKP